MQTGDLPRILGPTSQRVLAAHLYIEAASGIGIADTLFLAIPIQIQTNMSLLPLGQFSLDERDLFLIHAIPAT